MRRVAGAVAGLVKHIAARVPLFGDAAAVTLAVVCAYLAARVTDHEERPPEVAAYVFVRNISSEPIVLMSIELFDERLMPADAAPVLAPGECLSMFIRGEQIVEPRVVVRWSERGRSHAVIARSTLVDIELDDGVARWPGKQRCVPCGNGPAEGFEPVWHPGWGTSEEPGWVTPVQPPRGLAARFE
jgi:hypothetical protein